MGNYQFPKPFKASHFKCIASFEWRTSGCNPLSALVEVFEIFGKCFGLSAAFRSVCNCGELFGILTYFWHLAWLEVLIKNWLLLLFRLNIAGNHICIDIQTNNMTASVMFLLCSSWINKFILSTVTYILDTIMQCSFNLCIIALQTNKFQMNPNQNQLLHLLATDIPAVF